MEREIRESIPNLGLEQTLLNINENQMLQFTAEGFRLYQYVETGETQVRTIRSGESEYVFRVPVWEPVLQKEATSFIELFDTESEDYPLISQFTEEIDTDEFRAWKESLISPDAIKEEAHKELKRREIEGDDETVPCYNCKGQAYFENDCSCTHGGTTFVDMTDEPEAGVAKLREEGVVDPDCNTCRGSGKVQNDCPYCEGCAKTTKYPQIILKNEVTGEERILKLDLARLLVEGEIEAEWVGMERLYLDGFQISEKSLRYTVSSYIDRNIADMGIDKENAARIRDNRISRIQTVGAIGATAHWRKDKDGIKAQTIGAIGTTVYRRTNKDKANLHQGTRDITASDALCQGQLDMARSFAWPYGKIKNDEGVVIAEEWVMRPLRPIEEALEDLKIAVAESGYTLGFTQSFIATGETGPSFFLLDSAGNALGQLSNDYYIRESLENAWLEFQKVRQRPPRVE